MHRPAARLAVTVFTLGLLWGGPTAVAAGGPNPVAKDDLLLAANVSLDAGHTDHTGDGNGEVAEWPDWARVDSGQDGGTEEPAEQGQGHHTAPDTPAAPDTDNHGTGQHGGTGHDTGGTGGGHGTEGHDENTESHGDHGAETGPAPERPRALVLGSFAAVNGAVLLVAAFLRRRTKSEVERRKSARAAALRKPETSARSGSSSCTH